MKTHIETQSVNESIEVEVFGETQEIPLEIDWEETTTRSFDNYPLDEGKVEISAIRFKFRGKWIDVDMEALSPRSSKIPRTIYHAMVANHFENPKFS